jgi:hypothetical protein
MTRNPPSDRQSASKVVVTLSSNPFQTNSATTPVNVLRHSYSSGFVSFSLSGEGIGNAYPLNLKEGYPVRAKPMHSHDLTNDPRQQMKPKKQSGAENSSDYCI